MGFTIHLFTFWMFLCVAGKYFHGVLGQTLILSMNETEQKTKCTKPLTYGIRYSRDGSLLDEKIVLRGILDATGVNLRTMFHSVRFCRYKKNELNMPVCSILLSKPCKPEQDEECYCTFKRDQVYHFFVSTSIVFPLIDSDIKMVWGKGYDSAAFVSNPVRMPQLYDINNPNSQPIELMLELNGQVYITSGTLSGSCNFNLTAGRANKLELTPSKAARPLYMEMTLSTSDGITKSNKGVDYVSVTVRPANEQVTTELRLTYSMCVPGNSPLGSCVAAAIVSNTTEETLPPEPELTRTPERGTESTRTPARGTGSTTAKGTFTRAHGSTTADETLPPERVSNTTKPTTTPAREAHRCPCVCCTLSKTLVGMGFCLFGFAAVLAVLQYLAKLPMTLLVLVYTGVVIVCGLLLLIVGAQAALFYCDHCSPNISGGFGDCPLCLFSFLLIAIFVKIAIMGVFMLVFLLQSTENISATEEKREEEKIEGDTSIPKAEDERASSYESSGMETEIN